MIFEPTREKIAADTIFLTATFQTAETETPSFYKTQAAFPH